MTSEVETHIPEAGWDLGELLAPHSPIGDSGMDEDDRSALTAALVCDEASPDGTKPSGKWTSGHHTHELNTRSRRPETRCHPQSCPATTGRFNSPRNPIPRPQTVGAFWLNGTLPPTQVAPREPLVLMPRGFVVYRPEERMPRPEKVQAVADIKESLEGSEAVFLTEYRGLSVKAVQELRASLRASGAEYKVVKMTLARLAADDEGSPGLDEHLLGPTCAFAFAKSDPVATAKALKDFPRSHEVFVLKAGVLSGSILGPEEVSAGRHRAPEVLLAKIAGAAKAPLVQAAGLVLRPSIATPRRCSNSFWKRKSRARSRRWCGESNATLPADEPR